MPLQPMEEWVVFLIMGSVLPGYMFRYQYCLVGGLEAIVFGSIRWYVWSFRPSSPLRLPHLKKKNKTKNLRCGNRKGLLGRNDQTHHRMGPKTMESIPPSKRNTQADIQLRTRQTNHQQETDGCIQIKHNPEHQPSRMSSKSTAYVPPKTASTPTKANTQTCSYLDFNQFLIRRITRNICLRLRIKQIQILTCREQDIR